MSLHADKKSNTKDIQNGLKAHGLAVDKPSVVSDAFRLGYLYALEQKEK